MARSPLAEAAAEEKQEGLRVSERKKLAPPPKQCKCVPERLLVFRCGTPHNTTYDKRSFMPGGGGEAGSDNLARSGCQSPLPAVIHKKGVEKSFVLLVRGHVQHFSRLEKVRREPLYRLRRRFLLRQKRKK